MLNIERRIGLLGIVLGAVLATVGWTRQSTVHPGSETFTVRRLDWLAVELNASTRMDKTETSGYFITFVPIFNEDAIVIYSRYKAGTPKDDVDIAVRVAHSVIDREAKTYGFQGWLKVKEDVAPFPSNQQEPAGNPVRVFVEQSGDDNVGAQLAYQLRERFRRSAGYTLTSSAAESFLLIRLVSTSDEGHPYDLSSVAYIFVVAPATLNSAGELGVYHLGKNRVDEIALELLARADASMTRLASRVKK